VAERAAQAADDLGALAGWADNAAVFRDADVGTASPAEVLDLVEANVAPAVAGCAVAVRRFLRAGRRGRRQPLFPPGPEPCPRRAALRHRRVPRSKGSPGP